MSTERKMYTLDEHDISMLDKAMGTKCADESDCSYEAALKRLGSKHGFDYKSIQWSGKEWSPLTAIPATSKQQHEIYIQRVMDGMKEAKEYAQEKIREGQEPPWAWYQYMKLVEAIDFIVAGNPPCIPSGTDNMGREKPNLRSVKNKP